MAIFWNLQLLLQISWLHVLHDQKIQFCLNFFDVFNIKLLHKIYNLHPLKDIQWHFCSCITPYCKICKLLPCFGKLLLCQCEKLKKKKIHITLLNLLPYSYINQMENGLPSFWDQHAILLSSIFFVHLLTYFLFFSSFFLQFSSLVSSKPNSFSTLLVSDVLQECLTVSKNLSVCL